jgi:hypothetical protein
MEIGFNELEDAPALTGVRRSEDNKNITSMRGRILDTPCIAAPFDEHNPSCGVRPDSTGGSMAKDGERTP